MTANSNPDFVHIYTRFKTILGKYAGGHLSVRENQPGQYELVGPPTPPSKGRDVWFGAARIGKSYVSYHLMAVYVFPDLLNDISPELRKRMQGKSCFNFKHEDEGLFNELAELTEQGYQRFRIAGYIL